MIRDKRASHKAKATSERDVSDACSALSKDAYLWQMHAMAKEAVDEIAPRHLNKKGRMGWVARELAAGFDRVRKAYHREVKRIEVQEFEAWKDRYGRLLAKGEQHFEQQLEQRRVKVQQWQASRGAHAFTRALGAREPAGVDRNARGRAGGVGDAAAPRAVKAAGGE